MKLRTLTTTIFYILLGGCSFEASCGGRTLDMKNGEAFVKKTLATEIGIEPRVSCPKKVKIEKGGRFDCQVTFDGVTGVATVEQTDDKTTVRIASLSGLLLSAKLEGTLVERLEEKAGTKVKVDCGPRVRASTPGDVFRCKATDDAANAVDVEIKVKDTAGNIDFEVVAPAGSPPPPTEVPPTEAAPPAPEPTPAP